MNRSVIGAPRPAGPQPRDGLQRAPATLYEAPRVAPGPGETVVTSTCGHNCGGRCVVNAHVRDGRIVKISTDPRKWTPELPPLHACVRGFGQVERVYHPDRLQRPLRRTGPRGSGSFEPISWDEALDTIAREMLRVRATYGNAAILAVRMTYGAKADYKSAGREPTDYANSKLIVMWGWSPADMTFGTGTLQYLKWARKQGVRIVCVDPRQTRSSLELADEHVFIRPSTDAAALIAMAYVIASEGLQDQAYLDRHVLGFDEDHLPSGAPAGASYRSYLFGLADGNSGTSNGATGRSGVRSLPAGTNPIHARVSSPLLADLLTRGKSGGYPADIRMIYAAAGDLFNQAPNVTKMVGALDRVEFFVAQDHFLTPTARYADIVLPATTFWERNDMHTPWSGAGHYVIFMQQAIPPMYECRNDVDICADLAMRLGLDGYKRPPDLEWLREVCEDTDIDDFDAFRKQGLARLPTPDDPVAFAKEVRDPERHPFSTPSGKIEIYSTTLAA